jgi:hypothetical protein
MADNTGITPGVGATIAADDVSGVLYQRMKPAFGVDGAAVDVSRLNPMPLNFGPSVDDFLAFIIPNQVHVAVANTVHWDLFNADAAGGVLRVLSIRQIPDIVTAVTGIATVWKLARTTAIGTAGTTIVPWQPDTTDAAQDADMTCRSKPTGGATEGTILYNYTIHSEETNAGTIQIAGQGGLELVPDFLNRCYKGIVLRQNQGLRVVQITSSNAGNTGWVVLAVQE